MAVVRGLPPSEAFHVGMLHCEGFVIRDVVDIT